MSSSKQTPITELDFFELKKQFRTFLQTQSQFKDYNFEGSNMSVLLDILSYNTYQNNFYTNMAISEMFLDSAQLPNSIVSHAKELNYLPRSYVSSMAEVTVKIKNTTETGSYLVLPPGSKFSTNYQGKNYTYETNKIYLISRIDSNTFETSNINIYEGTTVTETYIFDTNKTAYVLENNKVDLSSVKVFVNDEEYVYKTAIFGVLPTDAVFYIEPNFDYKYAITFGKNIFGKLPDQNSRIRIQYRVTSGAEPNGASKFISNIWPNLTVTTINKSRYGSERETLSEIKYFAPKSIQIQERAVTSSDCEIILKQKFPEIQAISVIGGDELDPPQYGKVAITTKLADETLVSTNRISQYLSYLKDKSVMTIKPIFIQPEYTYIKLNITVNFDNKKTTLSTTELENMIRNELVIYNNANLNTFNRTLRLSKISSLIDNLDENILSNTISSNQIIEYAPIINVPRSAEFNFNDKIEKPYPYNTNVDLFEYEPSIKSSVFGYKETAAILMDNGQGGIMVVDSDLSKNLILNSNLGTVSYEQGRVNLVPFIVDYYNDSAIQIYAKMETGDIKGSKRTILALRDKDVNIEFVEIN